jgi:hypothetical protein
MNMKTMSTIIFYTNYIAKWCLEYTYDQIQKYH